MDMSVSMGVMTVVEESHIPGGHGRRELDLVQDKVS